MATKPQNDAINCQSSVICHPKTGSQTHKHPGPDIVILGLLDLEDLLVLRRLIVWDILRWILRGILLLGLLDVLVAVCRLMHGLDGLGVLERLVGIVVACCLAAHGC